jgi:hypothetical protein
MNPPDERAIRKIVKEEIKLYLTELLNNIV